MAQGLDPFEWKTSVLDVSMHIIKYNLNTVHNNFHIRTVHLDIIKVFNSPTNAQAIVLKHNIKIYIKIAPTCFSAVTPSSWSAAHYSCLLKLHLLK